MSIDDAQANTHGLLLQVINIGRRVQRTRDATSIRELSSALSRASSGLRFLQTQIPISANSFVTGDLDSAIQFGDIASHDHNLRDYIIQPPSDDEWIHLESSVADFLIHADNVFRQLGRRCDFIERYQAIPYPP